MTDQHVFEISARDARHLVLHLQGLSADPGAKIDADGLYSLIERMGYVQLDSVNTVARAHHMILFSRNQTYQPKLLTKLHESQKRLFENWTHDACLIPTIFYPYWKQKFARHAEKLASNFIKWRSEDFTPVLDSVRTRIQVEGPLMARQFETEKPKNSDGWWDWHSSKTALEYLWRTGELAVAKREGFQKVYDLSERVIPPETHAKSVDVNAFIDWACHAALQRLGVGSPGEIARFFDILTVAEAKSWCERESGRNALPVLVHADDGSKPRKIYARPDIEDVLAALGSPPSRIRTLSPFDPVLRDRVRLARLFNFDYRIEIFVPAPKRKYGYYVFPLLEGDRLIGRIDMKSDKAKDSLNVTKLWMEPGVKPGKGRMNALDAELDRIRRFCGLGSVTWMDRDIG